MKLEKDLKSEKNRAINNYSQNIIGNTGTVIATNYSPNSKQQIGHENPTKSEKKKINWAVVFSPTLIVFTISVVAWAWIPENWSFSLNGFIVNKSWLQLGFGLFLFPSLGSHWGDIMTIVSRIK